MSNATNLPGAGLWAAGPDAAEALSRAAESAAARVDASGLPGLVTGSPLVLLALAVGLALWLVGDRLFRPASSLLGAVIGALAGLAIAGSMETEQLLGVPAPYAAIGLGSVLGLAIGAAMYRVAVGGAAGLTLAGVAGAIAAVVSLHDPAGPGPSERPETLAEAAAWRSARVEPVSLTDGLSLESVQAAAEAAGSAARAQWDALPDATQSVVLAAAILGGVLGAAVGFIRPRTAGPAIAALSGTALWLGATTILLARSGHALPTLPTERPGPWLAAWLLVALVGFAVQRRVVRPSALLAKDE